MGKILDKTTALLFIAAIAAPGAFAQGQAKDRRIHSMPYTAGFVHASKAGKVLAHEAFGDTRLSASARFPIASISKHFLGLLVRKLIARGELTADTPISALIPELPEATATVQDLLQHRAGINDYETPQGDSESLGNFNCGDLRRFARIARAEREQYSNMGYCLLARGLERRTGRPFSELLRAEILAPVGMQETYAAEISSRHPDLLGYTPEYINPLELRSAKPENYFGSAGIVSSGDEMAKWRGALSDFFSAEELAGFRARLLASGERSIYEWGLQISLHNGMVMLSHTGKIEGHTSLMVYVPDSDFYLVVLLDMEIEQDIWWGAGSFFNRWGL